MVGFVAASSCSCGLVSKLGGQVKCELSKQKEALGLFCLLYGQIRFIILGMNSSTSASDASEDTAKSSDLGCRWPASPKAARGKLHHLWALAFSSLEKGTQTGSSRVNPALGTAPRNIVNIQYVAGVICLLHGSLKMSSFISCPLESTGGWGWLFLILWDIS